MNKAIFQIIAGKKQLTFIIDVLSNDRVNDDKSFIKIDLKL